MARPKKDRVATAAERMRDYRARRRQLPEARAARSRKCAERREQADRARTQAFLDKLEQWKGEDKEKVEPAAPCVLSATASDSLGLQRDSKPSVAPAAPQPLAQPVAPAPVQPKPTNIATPPSAIPIPEPGPLGVRKEPPCAHDEFTKPEPEIRELPPLHEVQLVATVFNPWPEPVIEKSEDLKKLEESARMRQELKEKFSYSDWLKKAKEENDKRLEALGLLKKDAT